MLNPAKTQCIFFGNRQILSYPTVIHFDGDTITQVKHLCVYMDRHMLFDVHGKEIREKVIGTIMNITRISSFWGKSKPGPSSISP